MRLSEEVVAPDQPVRERALAPEESFIVQAPAGSGKTELLIQRYLRLLACVDEPEQVMAATFTRKAAGEMRARVIGALRQAATGVAPAEPHLRRSCELARTVLQDEQRSGWQLLRHPSRLNIGTLDSFNAWVAGRAPLSAGSAAAPAITDEPRVLYEEAARATLALLAEPEEVSAPVATVFAHLDQDAGRFERLLVSMLRRRDQWLRHVMAVGTSRSAREAALAALVTHGLQRAHRRIDPALHAELAGLLAGAAGRLRDSHPAVPLLRAWEARSRFPAVAPDELPAWQGIANLMLTAEPEAGWRQRITVGEGFGPGTPEKKRLQEIIASLHGDEALREALRDVRRLPAGRYAEAQEAMLDALAAVLRLAAAELRLVFAARGEVDFVEIAAAAFDALGTMEQPTELRISLDQRVRHVLVDEFQDTSLAQFEFLQQLTADWAPGDGRTLFLVGDPMQSIYRFRQAEVALFMRVRDTGIGRLRPGFLQLRANFRSVPAVVDWNNRSFGALLPAHDDTVSGAVAFCASHAVRRPVPGDGVHLHWLRAADPLGEAERVLALVQEAARHSGHDGICILLRSRSRAPAIIAALRSAGVPFTAPDLENMARAGVARDLLALTRALLSPVDRLAWIALLRSPLCGLSLADLEQCLGPDQQAGVPDLLRKSFAGGGFSPDGNAIVGRLLGVLERVSHAWARIGIRDFVEAAWLELGGPATLREVADLDTARACLGIIETMAADPAGLDPVAIGAEIERHHGSLGGVAGGVQVMTVHRAKGLEFDTVIVPALAHRTRADDTSLLLWHEMTDVDPPVPVLAPVGPSEGDPDRLYRYLAHLESEKRRHEAGRLLYVACTRARRALHLVATLTPRRMGDAGGVGARHPDAGSLLAHLWPVLGDSAHRAAAAMAPSEEAGTREPVWYQPRIQRLPPSWTAPAPPPVVPSPDWASAGIAGPLPYEWVGGWARHAGVVVHHYLQLLATPGAGWPDAAGIVRLEAPIRRRLAHLGTGREDLDRATERVRQALQATLADPVGRWVLWDGHADARTEWALTVPDGAAFRSVVIDRSFVADGVRWVIDYKTTAHEGGGREDFLREQVARHAPQLQAYRAAVGAMVGEPIRTALYFPLIGAFAEVDAPAGALPGPA